MTTNSYDEERFKDISENIKVIRESIAKASFERGRDEKEISLMAVTKTVEEKYINYAIDRCGINLIGENRVQECLSKIENLHLSNCDLHLIGHLQTNKVRQIVPHVKMIQSVDSVKLAKEISKIAVVNQLNMDVLIEVNIGDENSKFGIDKSEITEMIAEIGEFSNICIKGLMAIPPICDNLRKSRTFFSNMYDIFIDICNKKIDNIDMSILSMGMSSDYREAILEGSNMVRIGSSLFGKRIY